MTIFEVIAYLTGFAGPPRPDNKNSIVGESPIEEGISRFWRRFWTLLFVALIVFAFYHSLTQPQSSRPAAPAVSPSPAASR